MDYSNVDILLYMPVYPHLCGSEEEDYSEYQTFEQYKLWFSRPEIVFNMPAFTKVINIDTGELAYLGNNRIFLHLYGNSPR